MILNPQVAAKEVVAYDDNTKRYQNSIRESVMSDVVSGRIPQNQIADIPLKYLDLTRLPGVPKENILTESSAFKPFRYDFGYKMWERQNQLHWLHHPIDVDLDLRDWKTKLSNAERNLMTHMFPLFVQNDVLVGNVYALQYYQIFKPVEIQLGIGAIINAEGIHQVAYSHLLTGLGFDDSHYSVFMEVIEMAEKYNFTAGFRMDSLMGIAIALLVFGGLTEGVQLFASFAVMFNFSRHGKLKGMGQVVSWSVRDESLHVSFVAQLFAALYREYGHLLNQEILINRFDTACDTILAGEHKFTDLAFELGGVEDLTAQNVKDYASNITDYRRNQFGLPSRYNVPIGPIGEWVDSMMGGIEHANFFETTGTDYSKNGTQGTWSEAFAD